MASQTKASQPLLLILPLLWLIIVGAVVFVVLWAIVGKSLFSTFEAETSGLSFLIFIGR